MYFTGDDGLQNMSNYQPKFSMLQLQKDKDTNYLRSWKSEILYSFTFSPQYNCFLHSIK